MRRALALLVLAPSLAVAGPPYVTDDPEPVEYRYWEIYLATQDVAGPGGDWSGTLPHVEVNYGVLPGVQLHLIAPLVYDRPAGGPMQYGYGDTELGVKWRFVDEGEWIPMIGVFPLLELPTGNAGRGLGTGQVQAFLPLWLQKSFGPWTTYGGGGFWINPGEGNRNFWFVGWQAQRRLGDHLTVGAEIFYTSPRHVDEGGEVRFDVGAVVDLSDIHHLLASGGTRIGAPFSGQFYLAWQVTFGPGE